MTFNITPVASGYQEIHPYSAMNIDSIKINTSLIMMKEWSRLSYLHCIALQIIIALNHQQNFSSWRQFSNFSRRAAWTLKGWMAWSLNSFTRTAANFNFPRVSPHQPIMTIPTSIFHPNVHCIALHAIEPSIINLSSSVPPQSYSYKFLFILHLVLLLIWSFSTNWCQITRGLLGQTLLWPIMRGLAWRPATDPLWPPSFWRRAEVCKMCSLFSEEKKTVTAVGRLLSKLHCYLVWPPSWNGSQVM